ncbi:3'-5' exonuclease [Marinoscillum furvescens]|uniref:DNA polymerase-3 subunit epsilon n=1 Tax=Marinoscillum furvescens DSM 4134 TaxID=1122208 RepID=A0A3D9L8I8_MARFU|nr:3'-5' exonuclease [Marinoscillum furvescens]REE02150.1 DNA polymerase-3 subunit epsilon [Marinoscillum furvescens DSM 4134]
MQLKLKNPLVVFDLETTGTTISQDRIVEMALIKVMPDGSVEEKCRRINPTIPIPTEVSLIHGIYDEDVKDEPTFKQVAKSLATWLEGCDLAGFNILKFDVPMLVEEFLRANVEFDVDNRKLVDAQKIFHLMEKRNLTAAYKFYCGKDLEGAHSALADTQATYEVLLSQIEKYNGEKVVDLLGKELGVIENDVNTLHALTNKKMVDLAGRIVYNDKNQEVFNFGKHRGKPVAEVLQREPSFYDWMMKGDFPLDTKRKLTQIRLRNSFG